ncbi:WcaI family glycosyltransferase [Flavobacteriaceae bacterium]|nr:WcaI family glycosyltransferase [Flavobacteriaceae bacterium]
MKKKITIIGINYFPEDTAIGLYTSQLAGFLHKNDIEVTVVTGFPYYPSWRINKEYASKTTFFEDNINGIKVFRYKQYVPKKPTFIKRIFHLVDFSIGSFFNLLKVKKTDVVLCIVPFIGSVLLGKLLSKMRGAKLWIHIQDFEFDAVTDSNLIDEKSEKNFIFRILFYLESKLFNSADLLSTISTSMVKKLTGKTKIAAEKKLLPNWVDPNFILPKEHKKHSYLKSEKFKILYSGNIGEKQDWDFFIKFAKELEKEKDVQIIVVGNGSKRYWLEEKLLDLENIWFYNPVAYSELSDLLCSGDLHILFQKINVIDTVMPSKILAMMASEKPSLITGSFKSEVAKVLNESNGGKFFETNNIQDVLQYVYELKSDKTLINKYGMNARKYIVEEFSKDKILNQFLKTFRKLSK